MFHVKHSNELTEYLLRLADEAGLELAHAEAERLVEYTVWILKANERVNVTAIRDPRAAVRLHVLDSLTALPEVRAAEQGSLLDLGTGGGFPGVPLAVCSGRSAVLLDSIRKKSDVVAEACASFGMPCESVAERAEDYARAMPAAFSVVVARAVAPLPSLVELARPLLKLGGTLVALKGDPSPEEIAGGDVAAQKCGMDRARVRRLTLAGGDEQRAIVAYTATGKPLIALPRRVGKAQSEPLA